MQMQSDNINELIKALSGAQANIESASKSKVNPFFKSNYADLPAVWEVCKKPLSDAGLAVVQTVEGDHENMFLVSTLGHISGQWMKSRIPLLMSRKDIQGLGSAITYARRYGLMALVGVCAEEEDDDGNAAVNDKKSKPKDMSDDEIQKYLEKFGKDKEKFVAFMQEIMKARKWNYTEIITKFEEDPKYTLESFHNWIKKKAA